MAEMMTAAKILHSAAGSPKLPRFSPSSVPVRCAVCGLSVSRGRSFADWMPPTATDWDLWHSVGKQAAICEPCAWVRAGRPPNGLRNHSHVWDDHNGHRRIGRRDLPAVCKTLLCCLALPTGVSWLLAVATDGRKHVVPRAPINVSGRLPYGVAFDDQEVILRTSDQAWSTLTLVEYALTSGATKRWILAGGPDPGLVPHRVVARLDRDLRPLRGTSDLEFAVFLGVSPC